MMKNLHTLCILFTLACSLSKTQAQYVTIPDAKFRDALIVRFPTCFATSLQMDTTCSDIINAKGLSVSNKSIKDLNGIQYFDSLTFLSCSDNLLTSLPSLPSALGLLLCDNNQLTSLPALPKSLEYLYCQNNQLKSLPTLPDSLISLTCYNNQLMSLPLLPSGLIKLSCRDNQLMSLPALPKSLEYLNCQNNQLKSLPALPDSLISLTCYNNLLTSLPSLPSALGLLLCDNNQLTSLPALPSNLYGFAMFGNPALKCIPILPDSLYEFYIDTIETICIPNVPINLQAFVFDFDNGSSYIVPNPPLCNPTNNVNNCLTADIKEDLYLEKKLILYPNPATETLSIVVKGGENQTLKIRNVLGAMVYETLLTEEKTDLSIAHWQPGIYALQIGNGKVQSFIKK